MPLNRGKGGHDNERLEFLGDAVLDLVIGHILFHRYRNLREGELTKLRASLVNEHHLAKMARE
jgi:ribonuclease III